MGMFEMGAGAQHPRSIREDPGSMRTIMETVEMDSQHAPSSEAVEVKTLLLRSTLENCSGMLLKLDTTQGFCQNIRS